MRIQFALAVYLFLVCEANALLAQYVELSGRITDPQGKLVVGASIHLEKNGAEVMRTKSDQQGHFSFYDIPAGNYTLRAEAPAFASVTSEVAVPTDQTESANLQF